MKHIYLLWGLLFFNCVSAQNVLIGERDVLTKRSIDTCRLRIIYLYRYTQDTLQKQRYFDIVTLDKGERWSHYFSLNADLLDSIKHRARQSTTQIEGVDVRSMFKNDEYAQYSNIYINHQESPSMIVLNRLWEADYEYREPIPHINWLITGASKNVLGYFCYSATCWFRGRQYKAWYTPEIPIQHGPWKFNGLPGAILQIYDTQGLFNWMAIAVSHPKKTAIFRYDPELHGEIGMKIVPIKRNHWLIIERMMWADRVALMQMLNIKALVERDGKFVPPKSGDEEFLFPYCPPLELE